MNRIVFTGHVGKDAEIRTAGGTEVCSFSVAVKQGIGRDAPTAWYRVDVWGKRGETIAQYIKKGGKIAVAGEFVIDEYEGKPQYRVRADDVDPFMNGKSEGGAASPQTQDRAGGYQPADLEDDVPFITAHGAF